MLYCARQEGRIAHGYGQDLIDTFVKMSSDELVNVNPAPVIEFLEYNHPGMYNWIRAIRRGQQRKKERN